MVWWLVVCFEDRSERDKNKRNVFLMCLGTVCTDMMMMGCVCVCDGPYTVYTLLLLLLLFQRFLKFFFLKQFLCGVFTEGHNKNKVDHKLLLNASRLWRNGGKLG